MGGAEPDRCVAPPTPDRTRRLGPARRVPEFTLWIARARLSGGGRTPTRSGKGAGVQRGRGGSGSGPGPAAILAGPTACGLPCAGDLLPWGQGAPTGPEVDCAQCSSSYGSGARRPHGPPARGRSPRTHPLLPPSSFLAAAGNEIPVTGLAPARAGLSVTLSPVDIRVARAHNAARGGGSWERDSGRRLGSGSDLLRPDSEAGARTRNRGNGD